MRSDPQRCGSEQCSPRVDRSSLSPYSKVGLWPTRKRSAAPSTWAPTASFARSVSATVVVDRRSRRCNGQSLTTLLGKILRIDPVLAVLTPRCSGEELERHDEQRRARDLGLRPPQSLPLHVRRLHCRPLIGVTSVRTRIAKRWMGMEAGDGGKGLHGWGRSDGKGHCPSR